MSVQEVGCGRALLGGFILYLGTEVQSVDKGNSQLQYLSTFSLTNMYVLSYTRR